MAASGYSPIQLYYSTTASTAPVAGNLVSGELAINITDGKLYYKDNAGTVQLLSTSTTANGTANGVLYLNGSKVATSGSALTFDGTTLGVANGVTGGTALSLTGTYAGSGTVAFINFQRVGGAVAGTLSYNDASTAIQFGTTTNHSTIFLQNNAEAMRLTSTGLGIGTSSPSVKLDVNGICNFGAASGVRAGVGTAFLAGQAEVYAQGSVPLGIGTAGAQPMRMYTNSTLQVTLDSSGNLGIGTSSPGAKVHAYSVTSMGQITADGTGAIKTGINFASGGTTYGQIYFDNNAPYDMSVMQQYSTGSLRFGTNSTERARIDSSGNLLVGQTSAGLNDSKSLTLSTQYGVIYVNHLTGQTSGDQYAIFGYAGGSIGSITQSGTTAVLYNVTSDQRLKENIQDADSASVLIDSLQVRKFDWKSDGNHQRYGFVAQELVTVAPEAVHQPTDPEEMMAVDYSKLVPMLVKEIQSLRKRLADAGIA